MPQRFLADAAGTAGLSALADGSSLDQDLSRFEARSVLLSSVRQLPAALALLELDGVARRLVLCPPDVPPEHLPEVIAQAEVDVIVTDGTGPAAGLPGGPAVARCRAAIVCNAPPRERPLETEWLLFTSGTSGRPKLVLHTLSSLIGPLQDGPVASDAVWSTFYDIRRYGGLQILLRALAGGGSLVLSQAGEPVQDHLARAARAGVTHMLGTPTHWRRALMSGAAGLLSPRYVRLSGEVADQSILDQLSRAFPAAELTHAYASTEAGVGFEVRDRREGFPAATVELQGGPVEIRVVEGSLRLRSPRGASKYLGDDSTLRDTEGFIDTGDMVTRRGNRYYFAGRREGILNVGGQKVHPEEIEAVIYRHPAVQIARVLGRPSPITGTIVIAEVVPRQGCGAELFPRLRQEILAICRAALPTHKVPAMVHELPCIEAAPSGKLGRSRA